jgi:hypothetical protein
LSSVIDGFEIHPLDPKSTLPPLISGLQAPKTAVLAFKYCGVKNKRIVQNSSQSPAKITIMKNSLRQHQYRW